MQYNEVVEPPAGVGWWSHLQCNTMRWWSTCSDQYNRVVEPPTVSCMDEVVEPPV